jgi:hypothetical protein
MVLPGGIRPKRKNFVNRVSQIAAVGSKFKLYVSQRKI